MIGPTDGGGMCLTRYVGGMLRVSQSSPRIELELQYVLKLIKSSKSYLQSTSDSLHCRAVVPNLSHITVRAVHQSADLLNYVAPADSLLADAAGAFAISQFAIDRCAR